MKFFAKKTILTLSLWGVLALVLVVPCLAQTPVVELTNPLGPNLTDKTSDEVNTFILEKAGDIIKYAMGILGAIALVMFIYGGFTWLTSRGASDKIEKGKKIFVWAVIGLAVIFSSYLLVSLVIDSLTKPPPVPEKPAVAPPAPDRNPFQEAACAFCNDQEKWTRICCTSCPTAPTPPGQDCNPR